MPRCFFFLTLTCLVGIGANTAFAQMDGMPLGNMGGQGMIGGQPIPTTFSSNGERIFFTGFNDAGQRINFSGGPFWLWMRGGSCADCHGVDGRGGFSVMMGTQIPPNITYDALTEGEHEHGGAEVWRSTRTLHRRVDKTCYHRRAKCFRRTVGFDNAALADER